MKITLVLIILLLSSLLSSSALADVVINEVELSSAADAGQWVELYNSGDDEVDLTGWSITPLSDPTKKMFIDSVNILAKKFYVLSFEDSSEYEWLNPDQEELVLRNDKGIEVDSTPALSDLAYSYCTWGQYPDGSRDWNFMATTKGSSSSGELCGDAESRNIQFDMDQGVSGSGYVRIHNSIQNSAGATLKSRESGSGSYQSKEALRYHENLIGRGYKINLSKSDLSARYSNTTFSVSPKRSVSYASKWSESSMAGSDRNSRSIGESYMYAMRLDSDTMIDYRNFDLKARFKSEFEGVGLINSNLGDLKSSEEYVGSFKIFNNYIGEVELSANGTGFVKTDREIGDIAKTIGDIGDRATIYRPTGNRVRTYERGTGVYQSDALIGPSGSSLATSDISLAHNISLRYAPANYSYAHDNPIPMSIMWEEGTLSGKKNGTFISSEFSNIKKLEAETAVISSRDMRTSANFSGKARLQAGYRDLMDSAQGFVSMDDEYVGNYSIKRRYNLFPAWNVPHISITGQGHIDPQDCNILKCTITLVNDGNRAVGPVFIRSSIPTGTSYKNASIQPFELSSKYANWSISYLGIGQSFHIDLGLLITTRKENYTSSSRAVTVYQAQTSTTSRDRKLRASNTSRFEVDWSVCSPQSLSATYTVTPNPKNPKILTYRLTVENLAEENMSANITATLPPNAKFINSTSKPEQISEDTITWTIGKLNTGKKRTISFKGEAGNDGLYVSRADVHARSLDDGREMASISVSASVVLGNVVYVITPTFWQDWLPCDENLLGSLSWNETMIVSGSDLGCVC